MNARLTVCWLKALELRNECALSQANHKVEELTQDVEHLNESLKAGDAHLKAAEADLTQSKESLNKLRLDINLKENLTTVEAARANLYWDIKTRGTFTCLGWSAWSIFSAITAGAGPIGWCVAGSIALGVNWMVIDEYKGKIDKIDKIAKEVLSKPALEKAEVQKMLKNAVPNYFK